MWPVANYDYEVKTMSDARLLAFKVSAWNRSDMQELQAAHAELLARGLPGVWPIGSAGDTEARS